jgi:hypothetical protein
MVQSRKIGVLTFHRCINYGSYWQARCLVEGLRSQGWDAVLLDHWSDRVNRAEWKCALRPHLPAKTARPDMRAYAAKTRKFFDHFAALPLSPAFDLEDPSTMANLDVVVVGSDEVWNLRHPWYAGYPAFFGDGLRTDRLVSYAASFGNHHAKDALDGAWAEKLRRFSAIGVRDENSRRLVQDALQVDPALVLDPCLLFQEPCRREARSEAPYVLVYGHTFEAWFASTVRAWADSRGARLVSIGYRNDWADEQWLDAGPDEFASAMGESGAVVTNFFHGCVFALVNDKPFVTAPSAYRANKVTALAGTLGATRHVVTPDTPPCTFDDLLQAPPDPAIRARIDVMRRSSAAYLDRAVA